MSGYKGHIAGGIAANAVYLAGVKLLPGDILERWNINLEDWQLIAGLFVIAVLFALFPDVDTNSVGQNIFFGIAFVADILLLVAGKFEAAAYLGLLAMLPVIAKHRGWTHHKLAMVLVPLPILVIPYVQNQKIWSLGLLIYGSAVVGYFSHLLLDGLIVRRFRIRSRR